jgi:hypothetical protein
MIQQRWLIVMGACAGMFATFLPWMHLPALGAIPGTKMLGWFTFVLFGAALALAVAKDRMRPLSSWMRVGVAVPALIASQIGVWRIIDSYAKFGGDDAPPYIKEVFAKSVSFGVGLYLVIGAGLAVALFAFALQRQAPPE